MALLWMDSFDYYLTADILERYNLAPNGPAILTTSGRRSSGAMHIDSNCLLYKNLPTASGSTAIMGFALKFVNTFAANAQFLSFWNTVPDVAQVGMYQASDGRLGIGVNSGGPGNIITSSLGISTLALSLNIFYYVEVKITFHDTTGSAEIRVNGAPWLTLTGIDTNPGAGANAWNQFRFGTYSSQNRHHIDDLYVLDGSGAAPWNNFLGDCRVDPCRPSGVGATTGWTPSAGSNFQNVDDVTPNDDTDFNSTTTLNATDTFPVADSPVVGAGIFGVQHILAVRKADAGLASIVPVIRHGGVDNLGTPVNPGTTYNYMSQIHAINPGTGAAWTEADFNAAEFGYKRTV